MKILTKVLVGSRLHGLDTPESDYDYRGIHIHELKEVLSPFRTLKNTTWIEGDEDNTSYELRDFCKQATKGNATILEVFFSNKVISTTPVAEELRKNWIKFMDTDQFVAASRGYAANQYNKMQLFDPDKRTPKFAVAYLRVLWQCSEYLRTGTFPCQIQGETGEFAKKVKYTSLDTFGELVPELTERFMILQAEVSKAYASATITKPDIKWIEEFIYEAYNDAGATRKR